MKEEDDFITIQKEQEKRGATYNPYLDRAGQTWIPGKVVKAHADETYDIVYQSYDGHEHRVDMVGRDEFIVPHKHTITNPDGDNTQSKVWDFSHIPDDYDSAVSMLHKLLARYPVVLVIDSLDQLTNNYKRGAKSPSCEEYGHT